VIRLTIFICESFNEMRPFAQKDAWGALIKSNSDEGSPAGMGAKAKGDLLHTTPQGLSEHDMRLTEVQNGDSNKYSELLLV